MKTKQRILILLAVCLIAFSSCSKTDSTSPSTATDVRDQYVGNWQIGVIGGNYLVTITKSSTSDGVVQMYNFDDLALPVAATVNSDSLYIPQQQVLTYIDVTNGYSVHDISGGGHISGNTISFSVDINGKTRTLTGTKI